MLHISTRQIHNIDIIRYKMIEIQVPKNHQCRLKEIKKQIVESADIKNRKTGLIYFKRTDDVLWPRVRLSPKAKFKVNTASVRAVRKMVYKLMGYPWYKRFLLSFRYMAKHFERHGELMASYYLR